jgi:hypothetical protein
LNFQKLEWPELDFESNNEKIKEVVGSEVIICYY